MRKNYYEFFYSWVERKKKQISIMLFVLFCFAPLFSAPCGDVNSSGAIDIVDALMTAQFYVGLNPPGFDQGAADVNKDGTISIVDALVLAQYYVGLIPELPGCTTGTPTPQSLKPRVIVTTDIGGTDPDDFQSMVHYLLYTDVLDTEGLISSPHSTGRKENILDVINQYEKDYNNLKTYADYPTPDALRALCKNGAPGSARDGSGQQLGAPSEGSGWIIQAARRPDPRPLFILVWGSIGDVAQAVHDAPDIKSKIRVYFIGGPNKKWCPDTYQYLETYHKDLWIIESNSAYRGFFTGGDTSGSYSNSGFVSTHVRGHGALGNYFNSKLSSLKMGDTPTVCYVLNNDLNDPTKPGWGGQYVRAWKRPHLILNEVSSSGKIETFGIYELQIPVGNVANPSAKLKIENQNRDGRVESGIMYLRASPKSKGSFSYSITSNIPALSGKSGSFTSTLPLPDMANQPSAEHPNWWTDDPNPSLQEGDHQGAKTVNKWRKEYLDDFAARLDRAQSPK